jgi:hypothetical protein
MSPDIQKYATLGQQIQGPPNAQLPTPIQQGAQAALEAAQRSMQMNPLQERRSRGMAMMAFMANQGVPDPGSGFAGNLNALNKGFFPAAKAYEEQRQGYEKQNRDALKAMYEQRAYENKYGREHMQDQLNMQQRLIEMQQHQTQIDEIMRHNRATEQNKNGTVHPTGNPMLDELPDLDKSSRNKLLVQRKASGALLAELKHIKKLATEFAEETKGSTFDPMSPYTGWVANPIKDVTGYYASEKLEKERTLRNQLSSALQKFTTSKETALKNGSVTDRMMDLYQKEKVMPSIHEPMVDFMKKTDELLDNQGLDYEALTLSTTYNKSVTPYDLMMNNEAKAKAAAQQGNAIPETVHPVATGDAYEFSTPGHPSVQAPEQEAAPMQGAFPESELLRVKLKRMRERQGLQ